MGARREKGRPPNDEGESDSMNPKQKTLAPDITVKEKQ